MIQNVLTSIGGVGIYGVISICIFVAVFIAVTIWMLCLKKSYCHSMQALPLEDESNLESLTPPRSHRMRAGGRRSGLRRAEAATSAQAGEGLSKIPSPSDITPQTHDL